METDFRRAAACLRGFHIEKAQVQTIESTMKMNLKCQAAQEPSLSVDKTAICPFLGGCASQFALFPPYCQVRRSVQWNAPELMMMMVAMALKRNQMTRPCQLARVACCVNSSGPNSRRPQVDNRIQQPPISLCCTVPSLSACIHAHYVNIAAELPGGCFPFTV